MESQKEPSATAQHPDKSKTISLGQAIDQIIQAFMAVEVSERPTVLAAICAHLKLRYEVDSGGEPIVQTINSARPSSSGRGSAQGSADIRQLKEQKRPANARQMGCLVAFYLQELAPSDERKTTVSTSDLQKYFKQAGFPLPTNLKDLLNQSKEAGYFDLAGRGEYRLSPVGYNLVAHNLPKSEKD